MTTISPARDAAGTAAAPLRLENVTVLGANGAMGAGSAALFAAGGCRVRLVARDLAKVDGAILAAQGIAKSEHLATAMDRATYAGMAEALADADLIFEALAEDLALKQEIFAQVDAARPEGSIVATVSSGLSIRAMCEGRSPSFRRNFAGIHLYNPPHVMTGCELIPHPEMPTETVTALASYLEERFGRVVVVCEDMPAFAGNRIGFKVLNEVAQLAETYGVQLMDTLIGPYTGRAMAPLATIDLVGWDVHKAIVENVAANLRDEAAASFVMPAYMGRLIAEGRLGDKTPLAGGFYRKRTVDGKAITEVLDPATGAYRPQEKALSIPFVDRVRDLNRSGRYRAAMAVFMDAESHEADVARKVVLGYISYSLNRAGEVVAAYSDADRIMTSGFNWAPASAMADLIGIDRLVGALERYGLPVAAVLRAAQRGEVRTPLFALPNVTPGRYFAG